MKSVNRRRLQAQKKDPWATNWSLLCRAIKGQGFSDKVIRFWFNKTMTLDDYAKEERCELFKNLYRLNRG